MSVTSTDRTIASTTGRAMGVPFSSAMPEGELHLVVRAGAQRVALRMSALRSVVPAPPVTRVPGDAPAIRGVVALAGELVPVVDLAVLVGTEPVRGAAQPLLVVLDDGGCGLALKVDAVEGHETLLPHVTAGIDLSDSAAEVAGGLVTAIGREGLAVLDVEAALADPRVSPLESSSGRGPQGSR